MSTQSINRWSFETAWLAGAKFDGIFIGGILFLAILSGAIVAYDPSLFGIVLFIDLWFLGYHHVIATFTKLAGTAEDRRENRFLIYILPFIVVAGVALFAMTLGIWSIITIYFFWQWYHYVRQSYGISSFYHRKAETPVKEAPWLTQCALWSIPLTGILYRCNQGWDEFLFHPVWLPEVPVFIVSISAVISIFLLAYWCVNRIVSWYHGTLPLGQTLFLLSHFAAFYIGYIYMSDINIGWLVANVWHNAQYILFVWLYNTKRFAAKEEEGWLAWASQIKPMRILAYFTVSLIVTTVVYAGISSIYQFSFSENAALLTMFYIVTFQTINFHHYIVDSLIWKARKKKHQQVMGLKSVEK